MPLHVLVQQERLSHALAVVSHAVARGKIDRPLLTTIRCSSDQGRLRLDATNLEIGISAWVEAEILAEGATSLPALLLKETIDRLPAGPLDVALSAQHEAIITTSAHGVVRVRGLDPEEYPPVPRRDGQSPSLLLKASLLKEVVREVSGACGGESGNAVFTNVLVQAEPTCVTFVGCDGGARLAYRILPLGAESALSTNLLVPQFALDELAAVLPNDGMVEMSLINGSQVVFATQWLMFVSRLSSGTYPNWRAVLPAEKRTRATLKTADLRAAMQLASLYAKSDYDAGTVSIGGSLGMEPGAFAIVADAPDVGTARPILSALVEGDDQEGLLFNVAALARILGVIASPEVIVEIGVTKGPLALIRGIGEHTCTHTLMTLRPRTNGAGV